MRSLPAFPNLDEADQDGTRPYGVPSKRLWVGLLIGGVSHGSRRYAGW